MFKYPARFILDCLFLAAVLAIPACAFYDCVRRQPAPPQVDMSQAELVWQGSTNDM